MATTRAKPAATSANAAAADGRAPSKASARGPRQPAAKSPAKNPSAKKSAKAMPMHEAPAPSRPPANLLRAGLQALDKARQDVAERQSRVFEAILGFEPAQGLASRESAAAKFAADAFGLRKFEAVFDQRVAHALERMGLPSAQALKAMVDEVAALKAELAALKRDRRAGGKAPRGR